MESSSFIIFCAFKDGSKPFHWESDKEMVNLDFASWTGGVGFGNCLVVYYSTERIGLQWKPVVSIEEGDCESKFAVVCEHKSEFPVFLQL